MRLHSLLEAVELGIVSTEGAFAGLTSDELSELQDKMPEAQVLVVFRSHRDGDWRTVMVVRNLPGHRLDMRNAVEAVRYVSAAATEEGSDAERASADALSRSLCSRPTLAVKSAVVAESTTVASRSIVMASAERLRRRPCTPPPIWNAGHMRHAMLVILERSSLPRIAHAIYAPSPFTGETLTSLYPTPRIVSIRPAFLPNFNRSRRM